MNSNLIKKTFPAAAFLALCVISYGLLIPWLGFYWDDWPYQFFAKTLGPGGFLQVFAHDRPALALTYGAFVPLLGPHPLLWQVFGVLCRWLTVLSLWWLLNLTWPDSRRRNAWAAALFAVYPGFSQNWISVIYSQAYLLLCCAILAVAGMLYAYRNPRRFWPATLLSLAAAALSLFSTEYFFAFEIMRPLFLLAVVFQPGLAEWRAKLKKAALTWLPYLALFLGYGVWRAFFFESNLYEVSAIGDLSARPESTLVSLVTSMIVNGFNSGWAAWSQTFGLPNTFDFTIRGTQLYWLVVLGAAVLTFVVLLKTTAARADEEPGTARLFPSAWCWQALAMGLVWLLVGSLPFWIAGLPFTLNFQWDRFTLALMAASALFIAGLVDLFIHTARQKALIFAVLIAMAVGAQFQNANTYKREWASLQNMFWQLTWRAPGLKPGTMLLTHEFPFKYYSDNSLTAPLNWIYDPDNHGTKLNYILDYLSVRLKMTIPSLDPNVPITQDYRALTFSGNTSQSVVLYLAFPGCLRVMDPIYTNAETLPKLPYKLTAAIPLSDLSRIQSGGEAIKPPAELFGPEPANTWCYYFEKADLARQNGDWQQIAALGDEARDKTGGPAELSEWLPFIEGYAVLGRFDDARALTEKVNAAVPLLQPGLCQTWQRAAASAEASAELSAQASEVSTALQCGTSLAATQEQK